MTSAIDYCNLEFTWLTDIDSTFVTKYRLNQDDCRRCDEEILSEEYLSPQNGITITCAENNADCPCQMMIGGKYEYNIDILGINVISESRILEFYNDKDGYIQTVQGDMLSECTNEEKIYCCKFNLQRAVKKLIVKFLSLKNKKSFKIFKITIFVRQKSCNISTNGITTNPKIDIPRVKKYMDDMGVSMTEQATSLMDTIEQYQKNQSDSINEIQNALKNHQNVNSRNGTMSQLTNVMSMFSKLSQLNAHQTTPQVKIEDSMELGGSFPNVFRNLSQNGCGDNKDIFQTLKGICSEVTNMRQNSAEQKEVKKESSNDLKVETSGDSTEHRPQEFQHLQKIIFDKIDESEKRIHEHVTQRMDEMELRLNNKLNSIFELLATHRKLSSDVGTTDTNLGPNKSDISNDSDDDF